MQKINLCCYKADFKINKFSVLSNHAIIIHLMNLVIINST